MWLVRLARKRTKTKHLGWSLALVLGIAGGWAASRRRQPPAAPARLSTAVSTGQATTWDKTKLFLGSAGLLSLLFTAVTTYNGYRETSQNLRNSLAQLTDDLFDKSVTKLQSDQLAVRVGGIYSLEQIIDHSPESHTRATQVLVSYLRRPPDSNSTSWEVLKLDSAWCPKYYSDAAPHDVSAAFEAIAHRRTDWDDSEPLDMRGVFFWGPGLDLSDGQFHHALLDEAHLESAWLSGAHLDYASLTNACLNSADLSGASLTCAKFGGSDLSSAHLDGAHLEHASFGSVLSLDGATFDGAILDGTHFEGVDLSKTNGLNKDQLAKAHIDGNTIPPEYLKPFVTVPSNPVEPDTFCLEDQSGIRGNASGPAS